MPDPLAIGIDLGATRIRGAVIDGSGEVFDWQVEPTSAQSAEAVLHQVNAMIDRFLFQHKDVGGIGVGAIGVIDPCSGTVLVSTPNIEGWQGICLKERLQTLFAVPVRVENDVNVVTLGEYRFGKSRQQGDIACVVLGTGVGIGIIKDRNLVRQAHELGHMVVKFGGARCSCGRNGCLDAYCSGKGISRRYDQLLQKTGVSSQVPVSAREVFGRYAAGDPIAVQVLDDFVQALSAAIANIVLAFSITHFIITGGVSNSFSLLERQVLVQARARTMSHLAEHIVLMPGSLSERAGVLGAASLCFTPV